MALIQVACDLCGGEVFNMLYPSAVEVCDAWQVSTDESNMHTGDHAVNDAERYFSSSRRNTGYLRIVRCDRCGLVMSNPQDDEATLSKIYRHMEDRVYENEQDNRRRKARHHLNLLANIHPHPGLLLDIGCSTGIFLWEAQAAGWQVTGQEPSNWAVTQARHRLPDVHIIEGLVEDTNFPVESFDVITLWDVLEHVHSPSSVLRRTYSWLKPGGLLCLNLPNVDSLIARAMGSHWIMLLREHLWYFSPATIDAILEKCGFRLLIEQPNFVWFSPQNILRRLGQYPGSLGGLANRLARIPALKQPSLQFPVGEMLIMAQKLQDQPIEKQGERKCPKAR